MDGSYLRPDGRGQPSMPSQSASTSAFKANVNRSKTKKWVEAKAQNYDGDDWGADDYDEDEDDEPEYPVPQQRVTQDQLPSQRSVPQTQAPYQSPSSTTAPPSQFQSYPPTTAPQASHSATEPASNLAPSSPSQEPDHPIVTPMVAAVPVTPTVAADVAPASADPSVEKSANGKPLPFIRPSDIYKRMEAERERQRVSSDDTRPPLETVTDPKHTDNSSSPAAFTVEHPIDAGFVAPETSRNVAAAPEPVTPQKSAFNDAGSAARDNDNDSAPPVPATVVANDSEERAVEPEASLGARSAAAVDQPLTEGPAETSLPIISEDASSQNTREAVPPLQTTQDSQDDEDQDATDEHDFAPTEPLKLGKSDSSLPVFEPKPIARETTFGTDTSSPVKESDVLREEIMRTLSPVATEKSDLTSASVQGTAAENGKERQGTNESAYTLKDYDSYWSDSNADPPPSQQADKATTPSFAMETVPEAPSAAEPVKPENVEVPSKASEDDHHAAIASAGVAGAAVVGATAAVAATTQPEQNVRRRFSWEASEEPTPPSEIVDINNVPAAPVLHAAPEEHSEPKVLTDGGDAPSISVAPASSTPAAAMHQKSLSTEAPRASVASDEGGALIEREGSRLSLADEKALALESNTSLVASSPPPESHPALAPPLQTTPPSHTSGQPAMTFREIMELGSAQDRIAKFNEARVSFATNEIGLHNWLVTMQTDHPEHLSRSSTGYRPQVDTGSAAAGSGPQPAAQQPYYQQYLNASSPSSQSPTGRSRLAGLSIPSTGGSSGFGQSSNQLGAKSKEFMQSAGKMGKGLLSKGKFKLRGSGDKGETPPSPVQPKPTKADRRSSWALNLGPKLRTDGASMQEPDPAHSIQPQREPEPAPRLPEYAPLSPFIADSEPEKTSAWAPPPIPQTFRNQENGGPPAGIRQVPHEESTTVARGSMDDWVLVSPDIGPAVPSKSPIEGLPKNVQPCVLPEDSGIAMAANMPNPPNGTDIPQRQSSFVGLPPIRRSSTFGLSKAKKAKDRFPLEEGDDDSVISGPWSQPAIPEQLQHLEADLSDDSRHADFKPSKAAGPSAPASVRQDAIAGAASVTAAQSTAENALVKSQPTGHPADVHGADAHAQNPSQRSGPALGQQGVPQPPSQSTQGANAIHRPPPVGPWKLEESYLSEPLNQVSRNRSSTGGSQSPVFYGFEKETGLPNPIPLGTSGPQGPGGPPFGQLPSRPRVSDTPPSSAQRYPDLFAPRPGQQPGRPQGSGQYPPNMFRETMLNPRGHGNDYEIAGVGPPGDERGRKKRNSGILKDIGSKIARATSRERRSSIADQRPTPADIRSDGASESSFGQDGFQEKKKRRSSFLQALGGGRASMDQGSERPPVSGLQRSQTDMNMMAPRSDSQSDRKKSFFGGLATAQQKLVAGASRPSFTGTRPDESIEDVSETTPKKKRFSDISKVFRRSQQGDASETRRESLDASQVLSGPPGSLANPMDLPAPGRGRSGTTGSFGAGSFVDGDDASSAKGRRGSASDFFSNLVGRRTGSRQGDVDAQPPAPLGAAPPSVIHQQASAGLPQPPTQVLGAQPGSGNGLAPAAMRSEGNQKRFSQHLGPVVGPSPLAQQTTLTDTIVSRDDPSHEETTQRRPLSYERQPDAPADFSALSGAEQPRDQPAVAGVGAPEQESNTGATHAVAPSISSEGTPVERSIKPAESFTTDAKNGEETRTERGDEADADATPSISDVRTNSVDTPVSGHRPSASLDAGGLVISHQDTNEPPVSATSSFAPQPPRPVGNDASATTWSPYRPQHGHPQGPGQGRGQGPPQGPPRGPSQGRGQVQGPSQGHTSHPLGLVPGQRGPQQGFPHGPPQGRGQGSSQGPQYGRGMPPSAMAQQQWRGQQPPGRPMQGQPMGQPGQQRPPRPQGPNTYGSVNANTGAGRGEYTPPYQQTGPTSPYEQQPAPATSPGRPAEQGTSKWKGIRNRMSEQMSSITQGGNREEKPDNAEKSERLSGSKILGAFKRGSKQQDQTGGQQAKSAFQHTSTDQSPLPSPPAGNRPPSDVPSPRRVISLQQFQSQQAQRTQFSEPQYDAVPIPQGYSAVHGEGNMVPTQYHVPRQMYQGQSQMYQNSGQIQPQYGMDQGSVLQQTTQQQQQPRPEVPRKDDDGNSIRSPPLGVSTAPAGAVSPAQGSTAHSSPSQPEHESLNISGHQSDADCLKPATAPAPAPDTTVRRSPSGRSQVSAISTAPAPTSQPPKESGDEKKPDLSLDTDVKPQADKVVEAKTISSPDTQDVKSEKVLGVGSEEARPSTSATDASDKTEGPSKSKATFAAELDDTEEARKRTLRLEAQEEKIHYDPQEDAEPQMSATSYPGDEWNPYGEVAFGDWRED